MMEDTNLTEIQEYTVLQKFEGDPSPDNLIEKIHIENGEVIKVEKFEAGELVSSETVKEVE